VYLPSWICGDEPLPLYLPKRILSVQKAIEQISKEIEKLDTEKPKPSNTTTVKHKRDLKILYDEDSDDSSDDIPRPLDSSLLMDWILERYSAWAMKHPKRRDNVWDFYGIPENPDGFFDKETSVIEYALGGSREELELWQLAARGPHRTPPLSTPLLPTATSPRASFTSARSQSSPPPPWYCPAGDRVWW
jgi:hypothetical protein